MIKHIWTVLCSRSINDKESNNVSLVEVLESVQLQVEEKTKGEPAFVVPFPFDVVTLWGRAEAKKPSRGRAKDIVLSPSAKIIAEHEYEVDLSVYERFRFTTKFQRFPVQESGRYQFRTQIRDEKRDIWKDVSDVPLEVTIQTLEAKE